VTGSQQLGGEGNIEEPVLDHLHQERRRSAFALASLVLGVALALAQWGARSTFEQAKSLVRRLGDACASPLARRPVYVALRLELCCSPQSLSRQWRRAPTSPRLVASLF
jgi:hypothetical protein